MIVLLLRFSSGCLACPDESLIRQPKWPGSGPSQPGVVAVGGGLPKARAARASPGPAENHCPPSNLGSVQLTALRPGAWPAFEPSMPGAVAESAHSGCEGNHLLK